MNYLATVLLMVAAVSAQSPSSTNKRRHLDIPAISREANASIVSIVMSDKGGHPIAQGSGFLISKDGQVVTNYHVIRHGSSAVVKFPDGTFFAVDGVLVTHEDRDVTILKVHGTGFKALTLGDSDRLRVGEEVVAIGNPLSLESTVSNGIVSAFRTDENEGGKFVQITAPISPGSSGGPLFNMAGEVVGITTSHIKGGENLNFAIPINDMKPMIEVCLSAVAVPLPDEPEPVSPSAPAQANTACEAAPASRPLSCYATPEHLLHVASYKYVDLREVPTTSDCKNTPCILGIYTVEGRMGTSHFVLQCKSWFLIGKTIDVRNKCWPLAPGKDYAAVRDGGDLLLIDGPSDPSQRFWSYSVLQETE